MVTAGKTLVVASTGTFYGNYTRTRVPIFAVGGLNEVISGRSHSSGLPSDARSTALMATSLKTLIYATSGFTCGYYDRVTKIIVVGTPPNVALSFSDSLSLADNFTNTGLISFSFSDTLTFSDGQNYEGGAFVVVKISDTLTFSDNVSYLFIPYNEFVASASDTLLFSDSVTLLLFSTGPATAGVTQVLIESADHGIQGHNPPNIFETQSVIEYIWHHADTISETQACIEVVHHPVDSIITTEVCIEVAYKPHNVPVKAHYKRFFPVRR